MTLDCLGWLGIKTELLIDDFPQLKAKQKILEFGLSVLCDRHFCFFYFILHI